MNKFNKPQKNYFIKWFLLLSLPFQFYFIQNDSLKNSYFIKFYVNNFNSFSELRKNIFSITPISIGDIFYVLAVILAILFVYNKSFYYLNYKFNFLIDLLSLISIIHIFFQISWGFNYHSEPLESKYNIKSTYSDKDLEDVILYLIHKTNNLHHRLSKNDSLPVKFPFDKKQARLILADKKNNIVKSSIWSYLLSYIGFSGYLNPFTLEAHVNEKIPMISYLTTIAHEQSHQTGIAHENESNFWAFKKTSNNKNNYVQYAGYTFALRYCISELFRKNQDKANTLYKKISPGIKKNFYEISNFWEKYKNPFEPFFKSIYDNFLKINNQKLGIKSYNKVVLLIVFEIKKNID